SGSADTRTTVAMQREMPVGWVARRVRFASTAVAKEARYHAPRASRPVRHRWQEAGADHQVHRGGWILFGSSLPRRTRRTPDRQRAGSRRAVIGLAETTHPISSPASTGDAHRSPAGARDVRVRAA